MRTYISTDSEQERMLRDWVATKYESLRIYESVCERCIGTRIFYVEILGVV